MTESLRHFFIPRESNRHRAVGLRFKALLVYLGLFLLVQIGLEVMPSAGGKVLGYAVNIDSSDLLRITNEKRSASGLAALTSSEKLNEAASLKAQNMFAEQYWAHTSPAGKDPWSFLGQVDYAYLYAGENLARDFADSGSVVEAWLNSPSHRENLLSDRYQEVGFAVVNGKYGDYETTLVVQMFGLRAAAVPTVSPPAVARKPAEALPAVNSAADQTVPSPTPPPVVSPIPVTPLVAEQAAPVEPSGLNFAISNFQITKGLSVVLGGGLLILFVLDALVILRTRAVRFAGHNTAHFLLIVVLVATVLSLKRGLIL